MNQIIPQNFGNVPSVLAGMQDDDLAANVHGGYGLIGYRGKVWSIRYRGEEINLMRPDGDGPRNSIEVVIVKASPQISKIWYENGYVEGSNAAPDCFSTNGLTPDASAPRKQCATCAACPKNAWGSRITPAGKQGKACSDSRRVAVVPLDDLKNEVYGGPMLLRIPAASLQDAAGYSKKLGQLGYPTCGVGTRIAFDPNEAFPKFQFSAIRVLNDSEAQYIAQLRESPEVAHILADNTDVAPAQAPVEAAPQAQSFFEQPPAQPAPQPAAAQVQVQQPAPQPAAAQVQVQQPAPQPAAAPVQVQQPAPAPVTPEVTQAAPVVEAAPVETSPFEEDLDAKLAALLPS